VLKVLLALSALLLGSLITGEAVAAGQSPNCPSANRLPPLDVLIAYIGEVRTTSDDRGRTRVGSFRTFGILRNGVLETSDGASVRDGMKFWQVVAPSAPPIALREASSFLDRMGEDHCVYHAEPIHALPIWTLLSSRPLGQTFSRPSEADRSYFAQHQDICVDQGDYEPFERPPCSRPILLAVSDLDADRAKEYWATQPYLWDTGIAVWRRTEAGLTHLIGVCAGCSD